MKRLLFCFLLVSVIEVRAEPPVLKAEFETAEALAVSRAIVADLIHKTGGDMEKVQRILSEAQRNPESLRQWLSAEQIQKIRDIAQERVQQQAAPAGERPAK